MSRDDYERPTAMRRLLSIYLQTVAGIMQRNVRRGRVTPERASQEAAHVFAAAGLMNVASVVALMGVFSALSHLQWFALFAVVYAVLYRQHHRIIVRALLPWRAGTIGGREWSANAVIGNAYLLLSALLFGTSLVLLGSRTNAT